MIHPDTPVLNPGGVYERLGVVGWEGKALGASGWRMKPTPIDEFKTGCGNESVEILTSQGHRLTCTPDQPIAVMRNRHRMWKPAKTVQLGWYVVCEDNGMVGQDRVVAMTQNEMPRPTFFVSLRTGIGNAFFGGVLCACR